MLIKRLLTLQFRKQRRHRAKDGVYLAYGHAMARHQLNDLSMGGLSFYYVDKGRRISHGFRELSLIDRNRVCLGGMPFQTVSDIETGEVMFQKKKVKRMGLRFDGLNRQQRRKLKAFISSFTE